MPSQGFPSSSDEDHSETWKRSASQGSKANDEAIRPTSEQKQKNKGRDDDDVDLPSMDESLDVNDEKMTVDVVAFPVGK